MKITIQRIKEVLVESIAGFIGWTLALTPYIWMFVTKGDIGAYLWWVLMEILLVPFIAPVVIWFTKWMKKKVLR